MFCTHFREQTTHSYVVLCVTQSLHAATLDTTLATVKHINAGTQHQTTTAAVQVPTYAFN
jgi:hypothetical protein